MAGAGRGDFGYAEARVSERFQLWQGDCLTILPTLAAGSISMTFADPPYNVGLDYVEYSDKLQPADYRDWCKKWFIECRRITNHSIVITPGMVSVPMWLADIERTHYLIAWTKQNNCSRNYIGKTSGFQTWEPILVYGKSKTTILRDSVNIPIYMQNDTGSHPCPKPLRLLEWIIEQFTEPGDIVFDPFMGSGTTGVAAVRAGRKFVGIEKAPEYFTIARQRITDAARAADKLPKLLAGRVEDYSGLGLFALAE